MFEILRRVCIILQLKCHLEKTNNFFKNRGFFLIFVKNRLCFCCSSFKMSPRLHFPLSFMLGCIQVTSGLHFFKNFSKNCLQRFFFKICNNFGDFVRILGIFLTQFFFCVFVFVFFCFFYFVNVI